jgi:hypothetical protein
LILEIRNPKKIGKERSLNIFINHRDLLKLKIIHHAREKILVLH